MSVRDNIADSILVALLFSTYSFILGFFLGVFHRYPSWIDLSQYDYGMEPDVYSAEFILVMILALSLLIYGVVWAYSRRDFKMSTAAVLFLSILPLLLLALSPVPYAWA